MPTAAKAGYSTLLKMGDAASPEQFTTLAEVRKISWGGRKVDLAEVTSMDSGNVREWIATLRDPGELDLDVNYLPTNATQTAMLTAFDAGTTKNWKLVLPQSLGTWSFAGIITQDDLDFEPDKELMRKL